MTKRKRASCGFGPGGTASSSVYSSTRFAKPSSSRKRAAISSRRAASCSVEPRERNSAANLRASRVIGVFSRCAWSASDALVPGVQTIGTQ